MEIAKNREQGNGIVAMEKLQKLLEETANDSSLAAQKQINEARNELLQVHEDWVAKGLPTKTAENMKDLLGQASERLSAMIPQDREAKEVERATELSEAEYARMAAEQGPEEKTAEEPPAQMAA